MMIPIRSMTVDQFNALWEDERFCMLNNDQLAAMGERLERDRAAERFNHQLAESFWLARLKKRLIR